MKYLNAKWILPDALVKELQNYVQGGYLYIPVAQGAKALGRSFRLSAGIKTTQQTEKASAQFHRSGLWVLFHIFSDLLLPL